MKVLVACEESQAVTIEMRKLWIEAYSCDIQDCSWGHPEWHIKWDAIKEAYSGKYDMMIAHPPCTYLCIPSAQHLHKDPTRWDKMRDGARFFRKLLEAPIDKIAIENPVPHSYAKLPKYNQIVYPYMFLDKEGKRTCFWLKNLPKLNPINSEKFEVERYVDKNWVARNSKWYAKGSAKNRSKTPKGIAKEMARQWGGYIYKM